MNASKLAIGCAAILLSVSAPAQDSAVLKTFEEIVRNCEAGFGDAVNVFHQQRLSRWLKREIVEPKIAFDVKRSDSLVSPFTATLNASYRVLSGGAPTKEEADTLRLDNSGSVETRAEVLRYAYQGGVWKTVSARSESRYRSSTGATSPTPTILDYTAEQAIHPTGLQGPIRGCLK